MVGTTERTPRLFLILLACVAVMGAITFAVSWNLMRPFWSIQLALVIVAAALSEFFSFELPNFTVVLAYPLAMSAVVLGGPAASGIVAACSAITVSDIRRRRPPAILAFNLASLVLVSCLAGWAYVLFGGPVLATGANSFTTLTASDFPAALWAMTASAAVAAVANLVVISLGISLYQSHNFQRILMSGMPIMPTQLSLPFVGFLMAQVLAINVAALPLFIFPLVVARQFYQRSTRLRAAYADTVRSLIGALEAKDPYTRGHSERVARYAVQIGVAMGMDERTNEQLEYAALLHDLGKLRISADVLTKPCALSASELETMRLHPAAGAAMVLRVPPLRDLADYVRHHHERFDGDGYPDGVAGREIPLVARILAVADAYDAMTTSRAYRRAMTHEAAREQLVECSGSQFDPDVVRHFLTAPTYELDGEGEIAEATSAAGEVEAGGIV